MQILGKTCNPLLSFPLYRLAMLPAEHRLETQTLCNTFFLCTFDACFGLLVRPVEDGNVEALLGNVEGKVLQSGDALSACCDYANVCLPINLISVNTCPITARPIRPILDIVVACFLHMHGRMQ